MGDPPQVSVKIPSRRDVPHKVHEFSEKVTLDFLLLTAVECEFLTCFYYLQEPLKYYDVRTGVVYVGKMGDETEQEKLTIGLMQCGMGSGVRGSAMAVQNAVMTFCPKGVFCVGFCGGLNANKAKLGDVAVSAKLISYDPCKLTKDGRQLRGEAVSLGKRLSDIMIHAGNGWNPPLEKMEETGPKVVLGTVLSGSMLVNFKMKRDELLKDYADAIAIEMEGEGVYTAAHDLQLEWVVVKGISDYADGTKDSTTKWKPFASMMAASLVAHVLRQPSIFQGWPRYNGGSFPFAVQCGTCMRRNSAKQDLPEDRENVDGYLKQMVVEAKDKFVALFSYLEKNLHLIKVTFEGNKINVTCRSLQILEGLWDDYCSGHLNAKAEECLITEKVKDELGMEKITLTTTISEKDYLACKELLTKISGLPDQSSADPPKKRPKRSSPSSVSEQHIRSLPGQSSAGPPKKRPKCSSPSSVSKQHVRGLPGQSSAGPPKKRPKRSSSSSVSKQHVRGSTKRRRDSKGSPGRSTAGPSKKRCIPRKSK